MLILDSHCHVQNIPGHPWDSPASRLIPLLDQAGIHCALIMGYGEASSEDPELLDQMDLAMSQYPGRLFALARLQPSLSAPETLEKLVCSRRGFVGLKLHPVGYRMAPDHPYVLNLLKTAAKLNIPTMFHCGDEEYSLPLQIARAARKVPQANIILGHMGGYFHVHDALQAALECSNIYLETSAMPYPALIKQCVEKLGASRVIFGSDGPGCLPALEVQKIDLADLNENQKKEVLGEAYLRLLRPDDRNRVLASYVNREAAQAPSANYRIELDSRVHIRCSDNLTGGEGLCRVGGGEILAIEKSMHDLKIRKACLVSGYDSSSYVAANQVIRAYSESKEHYFWCRLDPHNGENIEQCREYLSSSQCAGLFLHPFEENISCSSPLIHELISDLQTNFRSNQYLMVAGGFPLVSQSEQIAHLAARVSLNIIATSAGQIDICGAHLQSALEMMREHSNILIETSGIYRQDFIEDAINEFGPKRVVFGSGAPGFDMSYEAARLRWLEYKQASQISRDFLRDQT